MKLLASLVILGCCLAALCQTAHGQQTTTYTFDSDLDSMVSNNNRWEWHDRETFPWDLPDGPDGFAVLYLPGSGDVLYDPNVDVQYGFEYEISYFISGEQAGDTILKIQQLDADGEVLQDIDEVQSDSTSFTWSTTSGQFAVIGAPSRFGVFCQTADVNFVNNTLWGCAIDSITLTAYSAPDTTVETPTGDGIEFTFDDGTEGWLLGRSNGAFWYREASENVLGNVRPPGDYVIRVSPQDVYAGTVLATSPRFRVGDSGVVTVRVDYYLSGSPDYPVYLKLRSRFSYTTYDEENVILNMDPFGDQVNPQWLNQAQTVNGVDPGQEFNLVLEGNLGINKDFDLYQIMVSSVYVEGVTLIPYEEIDLFDFSDGLVGWQTGSNDGGKWVLQSYFDLPPGTLVPPPSSENILMVNRFDIHSGVISIESPPISIEPGTGKELQIRIFIRGSQVYPVIFRLGLRSLDGVYDPLPFIDLTPQGDANSQQWSTLSQYEPIPIEPRQTEFQLIFEVDLGGDIDNVIAIDAFSLRTVDGQPSTASP